ncbi:type-F conjugative transfer system secretin TraK [Legionella anisa]|uniref:type-F conjugative transfer system secretin TraK n=1 Tax=Legionella anisa TaxID=28082 RepID=UPI0010415389|nr:type-F conjugative transfer system secretin TraK [Legionella anisa]
MMNKILILALGLVLNAQASQVKTVKNYDEVAIQASITEPNTVVLEEDRIVQLKAPSNTMVDVCNGKPNCKLIDESTGALTFLPAALYHTKSFSLNISTEKGYFYTLHIEPKPCSSQTIVLHPYQKPIIQAQPQDSGYERVLVHFFRELVNGRIPEGFTQTPVKQSKPVKGRYTQLKRISLISGNELKGETFELTNISKQTIVVKESWFNWPGTKGVAVDKHHLLPNQSTHVYRISTDVH